MSTLEVIFQIFHPIFLGEEGNGIHFQDCAQTNLENVLFLFAIKSNTEKEPRKIIHECRQTFWGEQYRFNSIDSFL